MRVGMVVTDLDGTLFDKQHRLSARDRDTLVQLGEAGVVRVIATGRSLFSARKVLALDMPIDYLVHASGAGVLHWPSQRALRALHLTSELATELAQLLVARDCDFMLHRAIPDNHHFYAHRSGRDNPDFERRVQLYAAYAQALDWPRPIAEPMCQAVVIEASDGPEPPSAYRALREALPHYHVVRATSPLDGRSHWTEVFASGVGKSHASAWLRERHGLEASACVAIGNDYNDLDLLAWADRGYVVANAPQELRERYRTVAAHTASGFSEAVAHALDV